jgi:hypothetical protein
MGMLGGPSNPSPKGLVVLTPDPQHPSPDAAIVIKALTAAAIPFDAKAGGVPIREFGKFDAPISGLQITSRVSFPTP